MMHLPSVMVANLGTQPQVVTHALDTLLAQGEVIRDVIVLHPASTQKQLNQSLDRLAAEFSNGEYQGQLCHLRLVSFQLPFDSLEEESSEHDVDVAWLKIHNLFCNLKAQGWRIHVCVSGGRRFLSELLLSTAMLHVGYNDRVWHLFAQDKFIQRARAGKILHARPEDGISLLQVPLVPLGAYFPGSHMSSAASPREVVTAYCRILDDVERIRCELVVSRLTRRQGDVLRAFATAPSPLNVEEVLNISRKTVNRHKAKILAECRAAWRTPKDSRLGYAFIQEKFGRFFDSHSKSEEQSI